MKAVVYSTVSPQKDVDGFHPVNVGKLMLGDTSGFRPCTPAGVQELLARSQVKTEGAEAVIWPGQHRGQAHGGHTVPEGETRQRDGDHLPFADAGHQGALPAGGHIDRRDGRGEICDGGHGETRRDGD